MNKSNNTATHVYLYTKYEMSSYTSSSKNVTQIYLEKTEKWINKGKNENNEPGSPSRHITTHHPYVYMYKVSRLYIQHYLRKLTQIFNVNMQNRERKKNG